MNFFDFINRYRIEEVKREIIKPKNDNLTILAVAMDAGFNSKSSFNTLFPDLSDKPVKIGESWTTKATITEKAGEITIKVDMEVINTLAGLETVNGMECVKILAKTTGTVNGEGQQMGQDLTFKGEIAGSSTWYFAYKEGVFVKSTGKATSKGSVEVSAQNMTLPLTTESKSEISLIK